MRRRRHAPAARHGCAAAAVLALGLAGGGCAEVQQAPPPASSVLGVVPGVADPLRQSLDLAVRDFNNGGAGLADRPAEAADALARLEYVAEALPRDPRYAALAGGTGRELALARSEGRDALGVSESAPPQAVIQALLAAAARLRAGDPAGAARALPAPMFRPGGAATVARLGELGPLPQAAYAVLFARQAVTRVDTTEGLGGSTGMNETTAGVTTSTTWIDRTMSPGY